MSNPELFAGIDISERRLETALTRDGLHCAEEITHRYDPAGVAELISVLADKRVGLVVVEPSGGLERDIVSALVSAAIPVVVINGRRVRNFARSMGLLAKTDKIDARVLAAFGERVRPAVRAIPGEDVQELDALTSRRRQILEMIGMERSRLDRAKQNVAPSIRAHIDYLQGQQKRVEAEIQQRIEASPAWQTANELLMSIPAVGPILSATILGELPEIGSVPAEVITRLVGVAPINCDTGEHRGKRRIQGGRVAVRNVLFMATTCGIRWNPVLRDCYERLRRNGKPHKVAMVACMRKLLVIMNAVLRDGQPWQLAPV